LTGVGADFVNELGIQGMKIELTAAAALRPGA
jgi:hypothetical protein